MSPVVRGTAFLLVTLVACARGSIATDQLVADLAARAGGGVWSVAAEGCGWLTRGSAFAVDERHLVTNRHVIANDSTPTIQSRDGKKRTGKVIGAARHPDIAVIEVTEDLPVKLPWAPTEALEAREPLVAIGYPEPKNVFAASPGQIVNFQGPNGVREAALANTPINHGSSGGPGLRADASVAGVVTLMLLREEPSEPVAIMFTADTVRPAVTDFIAHPRYVRSTCGLGPDYIPPVPKRYDIPAPPPTARPPVVLPAPKPTTAKAAPTRDPLADRPQYTDPPRAPCPSGDAAVRVDEYTASEQPDNPGWWSVHIKGVVLNRSTAEIYVHRIDVEIKGDPNVGGSTASTPQNIPVDGSAPWEFGDESVHSPEGPPTKETTAINLVWRWRGDAISCPTGTPGPSPT
ncbi:MAG TPA: serine protease [Actinomycetota bacterium]|nr:serine protease [Actinomycetota bacterium]